MDKKQARLKRARRSRLHMRELGVHRLTVYRSPRHCYAQVISPSGSDVVVSASTLEKDQRGENGGNVESAERIGKLIGERALAAGITELAFDRSGYRYHGRVKALADGAREAGIKM